MIVNTLLELYIKQIKEEDDNVSSNEKQAAEGQKSPSAKKPEDLLSPYEKKALEFLASNIQSYDMNLALVICQLNNFKSGMLFLYEKNAMYQRILNYYMEQNNYFQILETCKRYGHQDPNLWIQSLQYFSKREGHNCKDYVVQILSNIEKYNLLTPLMVIKILSQNGSLTVDTVKVNLSLFLLANCSFSIHESNS